MRTAPLVAATVAVPPGTRIDDDRPLDDAHPARPGDRVPAHPGRRHDPLLAWLGAVDAPARADTILVRAGGLLERPGRVVMIVAGLGCGAWFLLKALTAFEVI